MTAEFLYDEHHSRIEAEREYAAYFAGEEYRYRTPDERMRDEYEEARKRWQVNVRIMGLRGGEFPDNPTYEQAVAAQHYAVTRGYYAHYATDPVGVQRRDRDAQQLLGLLNQIQSG